MRKRANTTLGYAIPFLKWAGGKSQLLGEILPALPARIDTYYEPFMGGGAVFFALANEGRMKRAVLSDKNPALVDLYRAVQSGLPGLVGLLRGHQQHATDADYYYAVRAQDPRRLAPVERAARTLFLNRTCFNGLYRVNRKGEFNVPFGRYANPRVLNEEVLQAASRALRGVKIEHADFEETARAAGRGDAVYFDPPYHPVSATASFTSYAKDAFGPAEHRRLVEVYLACLERGAAAVLSNSDCAFTRELYAGLEVETVLATRAINSVGAKRGAVNELLVVGPGRRARAQVA